MFEIEEVEESKARDYAKVFKIINFRK